MRSLSLQILGNHSSSPTSSALPRLCEELERTPVILAIDTFKLELNWENGHCDVLAAQDDIKRLDALFTRERFPQLRNFELYISLSSTSKPRVRDGPQRRLTAVNTYYRCLPTLAAMEDVKLQCKADELLPPRRIAVNLPSDIWGANSDYTDYSAE